MSSHAAPPSDPLKPSAADELLTELGSMRAAPHIDILDAPTRRRVWLPVALFVATCVSTFWTGAVGLGGFSAYLNGDVSGLELLYFALRTSWRNGLEYMFAVMGILLAHEMGHFLMTLRHRIPASLPFFIPLPLPPIGTMGAVIAMQGSRADRKQLFDIGLAGPLAGLLVAVPVLCLGIYLARPSPSAFSQPLLTKLLMPLMRPDLPPGTSLGMNPLLMAGWVGLLITGLNMMPISQLDGGHVAYALFRRKAHVLAYALLFFAVVYIVSSAQMPWILMLSLVVLIGVEHPPTANDHARLGPLRAVLGAASLAIPVLCFPPKPFNFDVAVFVLLGR
jgi:membrane-associated protease RseP (regulator of RpoE activity)